MIKKEKYDMKPIVTIMDDAIAKLSMDKIEKILSKHFSNVPMFQSEADKLIEDLNNLDNWIKCSDELPKSITTVLTYSGNVKMHELHYRLISPNIHKKEFLCFPIGITHWQPLPQPPKQ